jgi:alpha,alpha-trehalose phosphorylase
MGGTWLCVVQGFAGMRIHSGQLSFSPTLPEGMDRYRFRLRFQGRALSVTVDKTGVSYKLLEGKPLTIQHRGKREPLSTLSKHPWH